MRQRGPDKWFKNGQSDAESWFGGSATAIYRPGSHASNGITDLVGSADLTEVSSPSYEQTYNGGADDPLGTGYTVSTTDSHDAADATVHDITTESFFWLACFRLTGAPVATRTIIGKYAGSAGYLWYAINATTLQARFDALAFNFTAPSQNTAQYVAMWRKDSTNLFGTATSFASEQTFTYDRDIGTGAAAFSLGSNYSRSSADCVLGPCVLWKDSDADDVIDSRAANLSAWWSS
jgi:hypothetical protein